VSLAGGLAAGSGGLGSVMASGAIGGAAGGGVAGMIGGVVGGIRAGQPWHEVLMSGLVSGVQGAAFGGITAMAGAAVLYGVGQGIAGIGRGIAWAGRKIGGWFRPTPRLSGRLSFDFEVMGFRTETGEIIPFEQVQGRVWAAMGRARVRLRYPEGEHTLARLEIGKRILLGRNSKAGGVASTLKPLNNATATHAEGEVFQRLFDKGWTPKEGFLWVDRPLCPYCGDYGGIGSLLRATGMTRVVVATPDGTFMITAARPSTPIPIPLS